MWTNENRCRCLGKVAFDLVQPAFDLLELLKRGANSEGDCPALIAPKRRGARIAKAKCSPGFGRHRAEEYRGYRTGLLT